MNFRAIIYWLTTILVSLVFFFSSYMALESSPDYLKMIQHFGYPEYFPQIQGPLKLLGAIALLIPYRFLLKHWVYAGMTFNLIFAGFAHGMVGEPYFLQIVIGILLLTSYHYYEKEMNFAPLW